MHRSRSFELNTYCFFFLGLPDNSENKKPNWYVHTAIDPSKVCTLLRVQVFKPPLHARSLPRAQSQSPRNQPSKRAREGEPERERERCASGSNSVGLIFDWPRLSTKPWGNGAAQWCSGAAGAWGSGSLRAARALLAITQRYPTLTYPSI